MNRKARQRLRRVGGGSKRVVGEAGAQRLARHLFGLLVAVEERVQHGAPAGTVAHVSKRPCVVARSAMWGCDRRCDRRCDRWCDRRRNNPISWQCTAIANPAIRVHAPNLHNLYILQGLAHTLRRGHYNVAAIEAVTALDTTPGGRGWSSAALEAVATSAAVVAVATATATATVVWGCARRRCASSLPRRETGLELRGLPVVETQQEAKGSIIILILIRITIIIPPPPSLSLRLGLPPCYFGPGATHGDSGGWHASVQAGCLRAAACAHGHHGCCQR